MDTITTARVGPHLAGPARREASAKPPVRCRPITEADLPAVADLLARGFPARDRPYWTEGLDRLAGRQGPASYPRFGYLLESEGRAVGVILLICSAVANSEPPAVRCNLSSWYVDPAFRSHAAMLSIVPLRFKAATFLNVSPAPNTWATIEAQGFSRLNTGQFIAVPALAPARRGDRVERFDAARVYPGLPERDLLADHAALGCLSLVGTGADGAHPFVFMPFRVKQGRLRLPALQLVFCRSLDEVARFAGPLGRFLLRRGVPFLVLDAAGPLHGVPGYFWPDRARKYAKGAHPPRLGDLAYTEFTIFGP